MPRSKQLLSAIAFQIGLFVGALLGIGFCPRSVPASVCFSAALFCVICGEFSFFTYRRRARPSSADAKSVSPQPRRTSILYVLLVESGLLACICLAHAVCPPSISAASFRSFVAFFIVLAHILLFSPRRSFGFRPSARVLHAHSDETR